MKTEHLQIRISPELKAQVKAEADKSGKGISEWVIDLIKKELWTKKG